MREIWQPSEVLYLGEDVPSEMSVFSDHVGQANGDEV